MQHSITRRGFITTAAIGTAFALTACSGGEIRKASSASSTFVYDTNLDVVTDWDPATSYSNEIIAMQNIYESLTRYDAATKKVKPLLATSWTSSGDGTIWTFTLRRGVAFHSGRALDATAVKASIERTIAMKGGPAYIWDAVDSIETPATDTVVFHLKYASPLDLVSSSDYGAYIYDLKAAGSADLKTWLDAGHDAGSGPYTVGTWKKGQETELTLKAVKSYWGGWSGSRYTSIAFRVTPQVTTTWQLLQRGDVTFAKRLTPQLFTQAKTTSGIATASASSFQNLLALFNTASGPLKDVRLRKAVLAAIDVQGLVSALKGSAVIPDGIVPDGLLGDQSGVVLKQNLTEAKQLLAAAGYGPGKQKLTLTLTYAQGDDDQQLFVTLLSSALSQLNVTLAAAPMQWDAQWAKAKSTDTAERQDIFVMYWYPDYADPYSWFVNVFRSANPPDFNLSYLADASVDKQIDALPALTATDRSAARTSYHALQSELVETLAVVAPLYVQNYQRAYSSSVKGYVDNPAYPDVVFFHDLTSAS